MTVNWRRMPRPLLVAVASVMVAAGCGSGGASGNDGAGSDTPVRGGELVMAVNVEGQTMDPVWCATHAFDRCLPVFGTLLRFDTEDEQFVPAMASAFESEDGITWTLTLRDGVRFSDGTPFDADAVVFNWDRVKDPANLSPSARIAAPLTWRVIDPLTVEVVSGEPNYQLPWALAQGMGMIGSPTAITQLGADFGNACLKGAVLQEGDFTRARFQDARPQAAPRLGRSSTVFASAVPTLAGPARATRSSARLRF